MDFNLPIYTSRVAGLQMSPITPRFVGCFVQASLEPQSSWFSLPRSWDYRLEPLCLARARSFLRNKLNEERQEFWAGKQQGRGFMSWVFFIPLCHHPDLLFSQPALRPALKGPKHSRIHSAPVFWDPHLMEMGSEVTRMVASYWGDWLGRSSGNFWVLEEIATLTWVMVSWSCISISIYT
jgi:hypothetical protein